MILPGAACAPGGTHTYLPGPFTAPGDQVLTFAPYFPEYGPYVAGTGAELRVVPAQILTVNVTATLEVDAPAPTWPSARESAAALRRHFESENLVAYQGTYFSADDVELAKKLDAGLVYVNGKWMDPKIIAAAQGFSAALSAWNTNHNFSDLEKMLRELRRLADSELYATAAQLSIDGLLHSIEWMEKNENKKKSFRHIFTSPLQRNIEAELCTLPPVRRCGFKPFYEIIAESIVDVNEAEQAKMHFPAHAASEFPSPYALRNIILDSAEIEIIVELHFKIRIAVSGEELRTGDTQCNRIGKIPSQPVSLYLMLRYDIPPCIAG